MFCVQATLVVLVQDIPFVSSIEDSTEISSFGLETPSKPAPNH